MRKKCLALLIGLLLCAFSTYGQVTATGSLAGTVTDKSGAVVPNASVKISSKDTGLALCHLLFCQKGIQANESECRSGKEVLEGGFGYAEVACSA